MNVVDRRYSVSEGIAVKAACRVATTADITLSGEQTIDGFAVVDGDRVLVKDQSDATENGIYQCSTGNWTRTRDFDGAYDAETGTRVLAVLGTVNGQREFYVSTTGDIVIGTTELAFTHRSIGGDFEGVAESVDGEMVLFSGTSGKASKRATQTGVLKATSGVLGAESPLSIALGGTNATTKAAARTQLELVPGTHVQPQNAFLADIAGLSLTEGELLYFDGSNIVNLGTGTDGQYLKTQGPGNPPAWETPVQPVVVNWDDVAFSAAANALGSSWSTVATSKSWTAASVANEIVVAALMIFKQTATGNRNLDIGLFIDSEVSPEVSKSVTFSAVNGDYCYGNALGLAINPPDTSVHTYSLKVRAPSGNLTHAASLAGARFEERLAS